MYNPAKEKYSELMDTLVETMKALEETMESDDFIEWVNDSNDDDKPQFTTVAQVIEALEEVKEDLLEREEHQRQVQDCLDKMVESGQVVICLLYTSDAADE